MRNSASNVAARPNTNLSGDVVVKTDEGVGEENSGAGPSRASAGPADPATRSSPFSAAAAAANSGTVAGTNASATPSNIQNAANSNAGPSRNPTPSTPSLTHPMQAPTQPPATPTIAPVPLTVELKELPSRRRLDCGKGVDLGSDDAAWLERKDVPMDYDMPVTGVDGAAV